MISKKELAKELKVSLVSVDRMIVRGMPYYKTSSTNEGTTRFDLDEVKQWLRNNTKREV